MSLAFQPPTVVPDSYTVRRCTLPALRGAAFNAPYFGDCVGTGLAGLSWDEASPAGTVFYLVSGVFAGTEGSLGDSWNGRGLIARPAVDCATPSQPGPLSLVVLLDDVHLLCGSGLVVLYPPEAMTFVSATCTGVQDGFTGTPNGTVPGRVDLTCASATGRTGSGEIARIEFNRAQCPAAVSAFSLTRCHLITGVPDCGTQVVVDDACRLVVR